MQAPKEVFSAMAADFRKRNLSYADVAELTGYKKQTIANLIASRKDYLSPGQAVRFTRALGYNTEFLVSGEGRLTQDEAAIESSEGAYNDDSRKLVLLMSILSRYLYLVDDPALSALYRNMLDLINEKDERRSYECVKNIEKVFSKIVQSKGI